MTTRNQISFSFLCGLFTGLLSGCAHAPTAPIDYASEDGALSVQRVAQTHSRQTEGDAHEVELVSARGCDKDHPLTACVAKAISGWRFQPTTAGEATPVTYRAILRSPNARAYRLK
jgi:hypothetical protein